MVGYRIYRVGSTGEFTSGTDVDCKCDKDACELGQQMIDRNQEAEVWNGTRLVRRVSAAPVPEVRRYGDGWLNAQ